MTGDYVKTKLKEKGYVLDEVAKSMKVTPQNLHSKLRSSDVKVGVLEEIAKAINKSVYFFFENEVNDTIKDYNLSQKIKNKKEYTDEIAEKVFVKLSPIIQQILNKQVIIEAALAKFLLEKDED